MIDYLKLMVSQLVSLSLRNVARYILGQVAWEACQRELCGQREKLASPSEVLAWVTRAACQCARSVSCGYVVGGYVGWAVGWWTKVNDVGRMLRNLKLLFLTYRGALFLKLFSEICSKCILFKTSATTQVLGPTGFMSIFEFKAVSKLPVKLFLSFFLKDFMTSSRSGARLLEKILKRICLT